MEVPARLASVYYISWEDERMYWLTEGIRADQVDKLASEGQLIATYEYIYAIHHIPEVYYDFIISDRPLTAPEVVRRIFLEYNTSEVRSLEAYIEELLEFGILVGDLEDFDFAEDSPDVLMSSSATPGRIVDTYQGWKVVSEESFLRDYPRE